MRIIGLLLCVYMLSSCVMYPKRMGVLKIHTKKPTSVVYHTDTLHSSRNLLQVISPNRRKILILNNLNNSGESIDTLIVLPKRKIGLALITYGIAKDYYYPDLYLDSANKVINYHQYFKPQPRKHNIDLYVSFPYVNNFVFKPFGNGGQTKSNTGFLGFNMGLGYYHSNAQFIDIQAGGMLTFVAPAPGAYDPPSEGEFEWFQSAYISLSNNHSWRRWSFGYGLSLARNYWYWRDEGYYDEKTGEQIQPELNHLDSDATALGLNFPLRYNTGKNFYIGLLYKPYFYQFGNINQFNYQHTISFEFGWRIGLFSKQRKVIRY